MKSLCKNGMVLSVSLLWASSSAMAQNPYGGAPTLLPMPEPALAGPYSAGSPMSHAALSSSPYQNTVAKLNQEPITGVPAGPGDVAPPVNAEGPIPPAGNGLTDGSGLGAEPGVGACWADDCLGCEPTCHGPWFGSIAGLWMTRDNPNKFWTTYETGNNPNQLMHTVDADVDWTGGGEVSLGRWFCCCCDQRNGLEFSYFTLDPFTGFASLRDPTDNLSTPIDLGNVTITNGLGANPAADFFDSAREHRIWRDDEIHNLELNFLNQRMLMAPGHSQVTWLAGVRYFRFDESVTFGSVAGGFEFGSNGGENEAYLSSRCENNLVGAQLGVRADYFLTPRLGFYATPKIGLYGNAISSRNRLYTGDGFTTFDIHGYKNDVSMLGQIDLGLNYQMHANCRAFLGYRAIAVTGIALSDNQFLPYLADAAGFAEIKSNGDLILHGGMAGVEWRY